ncbi:MAG: PIN domain-containing protein [Chloroflexota bacterium]|nr:PIN domain-containing protein [Chloroflexota bacterium]
MSFEFLHDTFPVVLDTCVLFPATLRDTLFLAAESGLYKAHWSDETLVELRRSLVREGVMDEEKAENLVEIIDGFFPEAAVRHWEDLAQVMKNDKKDRHVLAAAVMIRAEVIVTANLKHFPKSALRRYRIEARSPDEFLCSLLDLYPRPMAHVITRQAGEKDRPPMTVEDVLRRLTSGGAPTFAARVAEQLQASAQEMRESENTVTQPATAEFTLALRRRKPRRPQSPE